MDGVKASEILRDLREHYDNGKSLSHKKLSEALKSRYNVSISEQCLKDYERPAKYGTTENISKGKAIFGMRIEYFDMFADFYGVSADFILGRSNKKTPDVNAKAAMEYTGLSESAVGLLHDLASSRHSATDKDILHVINILLSDEHYAHDYWHRIYAFLFTAGGDFSLTLPAGNFPIKRDELLRSLLELNNSYLAEVKDALAKSEEGIENGKH